MHIPLEVIQAFKPSVTVARSVSVTNSVGVTVPLVHHDVSCQLGESVTNEWYGFNEPIELKGSRADF